MNRRWWGGPGLSVMLHAVLLVVLIYTAARPPRVDATAAIPSRRPIFTYTATQGPSGGPGGGAPGAAPRRAHIPESRPLDTVAPRNITSVEPLPVAAVPAITSQDVDMVPGAPMPVEGTSVGDGSGVGAGGSRGPGIGPGDGPGVGIYEAGVGGVSNPKLIREVKPNFTSDAMRAKIQGVVVMEVVVLADGSVDPAGIRITKSLDRGLDEQAVIAVTQWRFSPSVRLGQPVASRVIVELSFTLR
jgi:protein TonB